MTEKEFFIDILAHAPIGSIIETTGEINFKTANELGLIDFKKFIPKSVSLIFKKNNDTDPKWIDFFNNSDIFDIVTHYWIYYDGKIIANGFDFPDINFFDTNFYSNLKDKYRDIYDFQLTSNIEKGIPEHRSEIELLNVAEYDDNFSIEIKTVINEEELYLKFAIEQLDFELLKSLKEELMEGDKIIFKGIHLNNSLGITIEKNDIWIDLIIYSSKRLISNLIWLQQVSNRKQVEKLIVKTP